jgi:hypothetical protein
VIEHLPSKYEALSLKPSTTHTHTFLIYLKVSQTTVNLSTTQKIGATITIVNHEPIASYASEFLSSNFYILTLLIYNSGSRCHYFSHFTDEEREALRCYIATYHTAMNCQSQDPSINYWIQIPQAQPLFDTISKPRTLSIRNN